MQIRSIFVSTFIMLNSAIGLYLYLGAWRGLPEYYSAKQIQLREDAQRLRPIYARLQRELVKSQFSIAMDPANLDLILHFATSHSQQAEGLLPDEICDLLQNILRAAPKQIIALNLLAMHAYKSQNYNVAIDYWGKILQQFSAEMHASEAAIILNSKIALAREFESRRTK